MSIQNSIRWHPTIALCLTCAVIAACQRGLEKEIAQGTSALPTSLNLEHDAGVVDLPSIRHAFVLANPLDEPIALGKIQKSCSCANCELSATTIPVGGLVDAEIVVDIGSQYGSIATEVAIEGRTPSGRSIPVFLRLTCERRAALEVFPANLDFGPMPRSQVAARVLHAWDTSFRNVEIVSVACTLPGWQCEVVNAEPESKSNRRGMKGWQITVRPPAAPAIATYQGAVLIKTSSKDQPDVSVPITASVTEDVFASPASLFWNVADTHSKTARVRIRSCDAAAHHRPIVVTTDAPWLQAAISDRTSEDDPRTVGAVTVNLDHALLPDIVNRGHVLVACPGGDTVKVPVTVVSDRSTAP